MGWALLYIVNIVLVNWAFAYVPSVSLPGGAMWTPVALVVGFTFVLRDYAQRAYGHRVLVAMAVGGAISWFMASPEIALASMLAFLISEMVDWLVYTATGKSFARRILISSLLSAPVDSVAFLLLIGMFSPLTAICMSMSKLLGALVVYFIARRTAEQAAQGARV